MNDELRPEYQFDYTQAKPNRFAATLKNGGSLVVLDPEVAAVFQRSEDVNAVLRAIVQTMARSSEVPADAAAPRRRGGRRVKL
jgi:hypothetical protein